MAPGGEENGVLGEAAGRPYMSMALCRKWPLQPSASLQKGPFLGSRWESPQHVPGQLLLSPHVWDEELRLREGRALPEVGLGEWQGHQQSWEGREASPSWAGLDPHLCAGLQTRGTHSGVKQKGLLKEGKDSQSSMLQAILVKKKKKT